MPTPAQRKQSMDHSQFMRAPGEQIQFEQVDSGSTGDFGSEQAAEASTREDTESMLRFQDMLMAHETDGLLILF